MVRLERPAAPEQTYVFGQDSAGGVFISGSGEQWNSKPT
jgi:hypothetical protein